MSRFFYFIVSAVFFLVLLIAIGVLGANYYGAKWIKENIDQQSSLNPPHKLAVQTVQLSVLPPMELNLRKLDYSNAQLQIEAAIPLVKVVLHPDWKFIWHLALNGKKALQSWPQNFGKLDVQIVSPKMSFTHLTKPPGSVLNPQTTQAPQTLPSTNQPDLEFMESAVIAGLIIKLTPSIQVKEGTFYYEDPAKKLALDSKKLNLDLQLKGPLPSAVLLIELKAENEISYEKAKTQAPVDLKVQISNMGPLEREIKFKVKSERLNLAGIPLSVDGWFTPDRKIALKAGAEIKDLGSISNLTQLFSKTKLSGSFTTSMNIENDAMGFAYSGYLHLSQFKAPLNYTLASGARIEGPVLLDLEAEISPLPSFLPIPVFKKLKIQANLDEADVIYQQMFRKAKGMPLQFKLDAASSAEKLLDVEHLRFQLGHIFLTGKGFVGQTAKFEFDLPETQLKGLEAVFPAIEKYPLDGTLAFKANLEGNPSKPESLLIRIDPLKVSGVRGTMDWESPDKKTSLHGPFTLNASTQIIAEGENLKAASLNAHLNLTKADIQSSGQFTKKAGQVLELRLNAQKKGQQIVLNSSDLKLLGSQLALTGKIMGVQNPDLDLRLIATRLSWDDVSTLSPLIRSFHLSGRTKADLKLRGKYNFKLGLEKSPLALTGSVSTQLKEIILPEPPPAPKETSSQDKIKAATANAHKTAAPIMPPSAFLPNWNIFRASSLSFDLLIQSIRRGQLLMDRVSLNSVLQQGVLTGRFAIARIFDGSFSIPSLKIPLLIPQADIQSSLSFSGINLQKMLLALSPEWKDLIKGIAKGDLQIKIPDSSKPNFINLITANGTVIVNQAYFSTVSLDQMAHNSLSKIPGLGERAKVRTQGVAADLAARFDLKNSVMNFSQFNFRTPRRDELILKGTMGFDKSVNLEGHAYLVDPPVGGMVMEANADESKRLKIPMMIKGNLLKPELKFAETTVSEMIKKTATYAAKREINKQLPQVKEKVKDEAQKQMNKGIKGLFGR